MVQSLVAGQRARGHDVSVVSVVTPGDAGTPFHDPLRASGVDLHVLELPARAYLRERREFRALCARLRPDVVHSHGHRPDFVDAREARRLGIPTLSTVHGFFHQRGPRERVKEWLHFSALRRFDAVVAVSRALGAQLKSVGVPAEIITALPNAFYESSPMMSRADARRALGLSDHTLVVGCVGRLTHQKALDVALTAVSQIHDLPITLSLVGEGEDRSALEERARALGIAGRVQFHGLRTNARELLRAFDVFLLCSRWEGTPIVLLEAMSSLVPIVVTPVGGIADVASEAEAILIPADDPHAVVEGIRRVLSDPGAAAERAEAARRRIRDDFGMEKWLDSYDSLYEGIIRSHRSPSSGSP